MKILLFFIILFFAIVITITGAIWYLWWYPKTYEYALNLADDASLPSVKADYLQEYLDTIKEISGPPRYVFVRPDLNLNKQRVILQGLITRFRDVAKLNPKEMAYQQGMFQLTGQEIDHQLERISGIFQSAKIRESPFLFFLFWLVVPLLWGTIIVWVIVYAEEY